MFLAKRSGPENDRDNLRSGAQQPIVAPPSIDLPGSAMKSRSSANSPAKPVAGFYRGRPIDVSSRMIAFIAARRIGLGIPAAERKVYKSKASLRLPSATRRSAQIREASATAILVAPVVFPKAAFNSFADEVPPILPR